MTAVFVHGNPEVAAIWAPLLAALGRDDTLAVSPPGFGAPVPDGFTATAPEYAAWLVGELERLDGPVDLIGHDWGGGHVIAAAIARPDLVRRVVIDIAGCFDPDYVWHDLAQVWRTPGDGEALVAAMSATPLDERAATLTGLGMSPEAALACASAGGPEMDRCILALYRSSPESAMAEAGRRYAEARPRPGTHVIIPTEDGYTGGEALARRTAERWDASLTVLDGLGHWWMLEDPARGAAALAAILD